MVLEVVKVTYDNKTRECITSQKLGSHEFWQMANIVLVNLLYVLYLLALKCCLLHLVKLLAENFSKYSNLDDTGISLLVFPYLRLNLKLDNIPKSFKKVILNLDLSKASGPDCIPMVVLKNCEPELHTF